MTGRSGPPSAWRSGQPQPFSWQAGLSYSWRSGYPACQTGHPLLDSLACPLPIDFLGPLPDNLACPPTGKYDGRARSYSSLNILLLLTVLFGPLPGDLLRSLPVDLLRPLPGDPVWPPSASKASMYPVCRIELNVLYDIFVTNYLSCCRFYLLRPQNFYLFTRSSLTSFLSLF
jgi:hypothetical protein